MLATENPARKISASSIFSDVRLAMAEAILVDDAAKLRLLIRIHPAAKLDHPGKESITLLYWAIAQWAEKCVAVLLEHGADPDIPWKLDGAPQGTLLATAVGNPSDNIFKSLIAAGANPNGKIGEVPAVVAAVYLERFDRMRMLINAGADAFTADPASGHPIAFLCAQHLAFDHVLDLLENGASLHATNGAGENLEAFVDWQTRDLSPKQARDREALRGYIDQHQ